eukprot:m.136579 g.136579  ORF g.136579 m.136579 type:complete len:388 (+) comp29864_c0_seq1:296-1459(+)
MGNGVSRESSLKPTILQVRGLDIDHDAVDHDSDFQRERTSITDNNARLTSNHAEPPASPEALRIPLSPPIFSSRFVIGGQFGSCRRDEIHKNIPKPSNSWAADDANIVTPVTALPSAICAGYSLRREVKRINGAVQCIIGQDLTSLLPIVLKIYEFDQAQTTPASAIEMETLLSQQLKQKRTQNVTEDVCCFDFHTKHAFFVVKALSGPTLDECIYTMDFSWRKTVLCNVITAAKYLIECGYPDTMISLENKHIQMVHPGRGARAVVINWLEQFFLYDRAEGEQPSKLPTAFDQQQGTDDTTWARHSLIDRVLRFTLELFSQQLTADDDLSEDEIHNHMQTISLESDNTHLQQLKDFIVDISKKTSTEATVEAKLAAVLNSDFLSAC